MMFKTQKRGLYDSHKMRLRAIFAQTKGTARKNDGELQREIHVTLPKLNLLTVEEIDAKYGPLKGFR